MAASAAATRSGSFAWSISSRAALYCGSHSGNLKSSFIMVAPLTSGQVPLVGGGDASAGSTSEAIAVALENVERGIPHGRPVSGGTRTVAHGGRSGRCVTRLDHYIPAAHEQLDFY